VVGYCSQYRAIFQQEIKNVDIHSCHPLIEALKKYLQKTRSNVEGIPRVFMKLTLPILVQTVANPISITGKKKTEKSISLLY
jgi:hypothetical protein